MITEALILLPGNTGTKQEIFNKISEVFNLNLENQESANYKTLN
jgi:predicted Rossmann-fold nucleotide-binding protein